jgi:hypothetical protein
LTRVTPKRFHPILGFLGASQIDDDIAGRLRATNQKVAIGWFVERFRLVGDRAGNQTAFTVVTNAGSARPTDRDVACLGKFQDALVARRVPVRGNATAREGYQRTRARVVGGRMGNSGRCADHTRGHGFAAIKDFDVNLLRCHA